MVTIFCNCETTGEILKFIESPNIIAVLYEAIISEKFPRDVSSARKAIRIISLLNKYVTIQLIINNTTDIFLLILNSIIFNQDFRMLSSLFDK